MQLDVSRAVVSDLWPLYRSGEASPDTSALVDAFLARDPSFATTLEEAETMTEIVPPVTLSPDAERRLLADIHQRARTRLLIVAGAVAAASLLLSVALAGALVVVARAW